jgi:hypothetical protein
MKNDFKDVVFKAWITGMLVMATVGVIFSPPAWVFDCTVIAGFGGVLAIIWFGP